MRLDQIKVQTKAGIQVLDENGAVVAKQATFNYTMPETLDEAKSLIGETAVFEEFLGGFTVTIQGPARKVLEGCESNDLEANSRAVQEFMDSWKYGDKAPRGRAAKVDHVGAILANWDNMPLEEQQRILQALGPKVGLTTVISEDGQEEAPTGRRSARVGR